MKRTLTSCLLLIACACSKETTSHAKDTTTHTPPAHTTPAPTTTAPTVPPPTTTPPVATTPQPVTPPSSDSPLAGDQEAVDRALVQQVHQVLQADLSLSTEAKTITIKAKDGAVTLDGLVQSEEEKSSVEALIKAIPGVQRVDNQLLVKTS